MMHTCARLAAWDPHMARGHTDTREHWDGPLACIDRYVGVFIIHPTLADPRRLCPTSLNGSKGKMAPMTTWLEEQNGPGVKWLQVIQKSMTSDQSLGATTYFCKADHPLRGNRGGATHWQKTPRNHVKVRSPHP